VMARYLVILGRGAIDPLLASSLPNLLGAVLALWLIRRREHAH
jgi:lipopolysaccharide export LptBFGC system permease protein LptF